MTAAADMTADLDLDLAARQVWAALDALFDYADSKVLALNDEIIYDKHYQVPGIVAARLLEALDALRESEAQDHLVTKVGFLDALLREARKGQAR